MTDLRKAAEMALEALQDTCDHLPARSGVEREVDEAITALQVALAQPEHEPVAYVHLKEWLDDTLWPEDAFSQNPHEEMTPLYLAPPKKEWVGLTEEEIFQAYKPEMEGMPFNKPTLAVIAGYIEAKLKEKNNG